MLNRQMLKLAEWDDYITEGIYEDGLEMTEVETEVVEEKIKMVMERFEATKQRNRELLS